MDEVLITGYKLFKPDCSSREKTQFCTTGYAMRLVRPPSHCSSQLQSGIVGNLTKNLQQPAGTKGSVEESLKYLAADIFDIFADILSSSPSWSWVLDRVRRHGGQPAFPRALLLKLIFGHTTLHTHIDHCLTAIWATF